MTQPACCARMQSHLTREEAEVGRLARIMARRHAQSRPIEKYRAQLAAAKAAVAERRRVIEDHEADHAGQAA